MPVRILGAGIALLLGLQGLAQVLGGFAVPAACREQDAQVVLAGGEHGSSLWKFGPRVDLLGPIEGQPEALLRLVQAAAALEQDAKVIEADQHVGMPIGIELLLDALSLA